MDLPVRSTKPDLGITFFQSRWYDSYLNQWLQPDSIIPDQYNPLDWNRYSYVRNNPVNLNDPSGHIPACDKDDWACQFHWDDPVVEEEPYVPGPLDPVIETIVTSLCDVCDYMNMADACMQGECSPWFLVGMLPIVPGSLGKYGDDGIFLWKEIVESRQAMKQFDKLSSAAKKAYEDVLTKLAAGDLRGLNAHALKGERAGQWAADIPGMGKGRGGGRVIYQVLEDGVIEVVEIITGHKYK